MERTWPALQVGVRGPTPLASDLVQAALVDFEVTAVDEPTDAILRAFFTTPAERDIAADALAAAFPEYTLTRVDVPDDDWAARSQANLRAIQVGRIIVAPPWDVPEGPPRATHSADGTRAAADPSSASPLVLVIQPSMGFGTGHHATTRLCLRALQDVDLRGRCVIDVGTGSGVLALAASRLGAATVVAIDDDPDAIESARDSAALNPGAPVAYRIGDFRSTPLPVADIVVANLTGGLLVNAASSLQALTAVGGRLILSGFMEHEEPEVLHEFANHVVEGRRHEDEWLCVTLLRPDAPR